MQSTETDALLQTASRALSKVVTWENEEDSENPLNFSDQQKILIGFVLSAIASSNYFFFDHRTTSGVMFAPALPSVLADFNSDSETLAALYVSIFVAGYAIGPLVWAPLSELYGRRVINILTNVAFLATEITSDAAPSIVFLIVARFFGGFFSSARFVLGGAIVNDVIDRQHQGKVMAILNFGGTVCSVIGPSLYIHLS